jgi:hypothetical protein
MKDLFIVKISYIVAHIMVMGKSKCIYMATTVCICTENRREEIGNWDKMI